MKTRLSIIIFILILTSCISKKNSIEFIEKTTGRYLFNANETIEIYFKESILYAKWRGKNNIKPLKLNDSSFYFKEMNEKLLFNFHPETHIKLTEKREHKGKIYHFKKMMEGEKTAGEYFKDKEFDKALNAFLIIQKKDPLDSNIRERLINDLGYDFIRKSDFESAIEIFKINISLYPISSNVYDSLAEAYLLNKDTVNAVKNYEKSLDLDNDNRNAERALKRIYK